MPSVFTMSGSSTPCSWTFVPEKASPPASAIGAAAGAIATPSGPPVAARCVGGLRTAMGCGIARGGTPFATAGRLA